MSLFDAPQLNGAGEVDKLTPRQREILELVAQGFTNQEVASALGISAATVRTHLTAVLATLDVANRTEAAAAYFAWRARVEQLGEILKRPAISVLPFQALDGDGRLLSAAAGITHDLAGLFARWCWFPVIAADVGASGRVAGQSSRSLGQQLGARFVVDGTLRPRGASWQLSVRLEEVPDGYCLWTERYELRPSEIFEIEDAICASIVASAYPVLIARVSAGLFERRGAGSERLPGWELSHQGMALYARREKQANGDAQARFTAALERDPGLVLAYFGRGLASYDELLNQWGPKDAALERLRLASERCIELAPHTGEGYFLLGRYHQTHGEHALATRALEMAIGHNPSFAPAHALLAQTLALTGRLDEGLSRMKQALRLGPRSYVAGLAVVHFVRGEYADALWAAEQALATNLSYPFARVIAAASAWWLGDAAVASSHLQALRRLAPHFTPRNFLTFGAEVSGVERIVRALEAMDAIR